MSNFYNYVNCCNRSYAEPYLLNKFTPQLSTNEINNLQKNCRNHIKKLKADLKKLSNTCIKNQNSKNTISNTQKNLQLNAQPIPEIQQQKLAEPSWNVFAKNNLKNLNNLNNSYDYNPFSDYDEENGSIPIWKNNINNQQYNQQQYNDQHY